MSTTIGAHARRFRFGVEMQGPFDATTWAESAREIEAIRLIADDGAIPPAFFSLAFDT